MVVTTTAVTGDIILCTVRSVHIFSEGHTLSFTVETEQNHGQM